MQTYVFHVSLPGAGRAWRKVELPADWTLEDLHFAIQHAFGWGADHLYSFFMSGKAWDITTEYCLPEGADPFDFDLMDEEDEEMEEPAIGAEDELVDADLPSAEQLEQMAAMLESNPDLRSQMIEAFQAETHVPHEMATFLMDHLRDLFALAQSEPLADMFGDEPEPGDVRTTTLESLNLRVGQTFMYLFDYGDEWRFKVRVHAINPAAVPGAKYPLLVESVGAAPAQYPDWDDEEEA